MCIGLTHRNTFLKTRSKYTVEIHGRYLYGDQDHLTYFGSYYMGREFHKHERLLKHSHGNALQ